MRPLGPNATLTPQGEGQKKRRRNRSGNALKKNSRQPQGAAHTAAKTAPQDSRVHTLRVSFRWRNTPPNKGDVAQPWLPLKHPDVQAVE